MAGGGAVGLDYLNLQQRAAELATSVIYDRAGSGWSQRIDLPRPSAEVIEEPRALLTAAEVPAPYLLVGHSLGGLYARHYAQQYSGEISGLVLLDPAHEDYNAYMPKDLVDQWSSWDADEVLPDDLPEELIQFYRALFEQEMIDWPPDIRDVLIERHVSADWLRAGLQEAKNIDQLYDEVRHAGQMPDLPLIRASPSRCCARRLKARTASTPRGPSPSGMARTGSSRMSGTSPCTSATPMPCSKQSKTYSTDSTGSEARGLRTAMAPGA